MGIAQTTSAIMIFLTGLVPASCHKSAPQQKSAPSAVVAGGTNGATNLARHNLGEITLTNRSETCLQLASGESFTLTPKLIDRNNVQITLAVESKNDYGETHNFSVTQIIAQPGKMQEVAVGNLNLAFTPILATQ